MIYNVCTQYGFIATKGTKGKQEKIPNLHDRFKVAFNIKTLEYYL